MDSIKQTRIIHDVYTHATFYDAFHKDLENAKALVIIQSPFITERRIAMLEPYLIACVRRRVRVCVFIQRPRDTDENGLARLKAIRELGKRLTSYGIHFNMRDRIHEKLAVIDDKVFWEGSLNILSHNQSNERMNRWSNSRALREALISHKLDSCGDCRKRGSMKQFSRDSECDFEHRRMVADITNRRIELGLSQRQLAMMVGVSRLTICHFESGKYDIRLWTLLKICESLDFKLKALSWHYIPALNDILDSDSKLCSPMRNTSTKR